MNVTSVTKADSDLPAGRPVGAEEPARVEAVQLVPENATPGRGGFPIDVPANQNQAVWLDVYTAHGLPAGVYEGTARVEAGGGVTLVPIELQLFDFDFPDQNSMSAMVYFEADQLPTYQGRSDLEARYHRFAHRNRVELVNAYDPSSLAANEGRFNGNDFSAQASYEGPGAGTGNLIAPASFYGPGTAYDVQSSAWSTADAFMSALSAHAPRAMTFLYMPDEPSASEYGQIETIAGN